MRPGLATTLKASYLAPVTPFAELLDRLLYTPQRNAKVALLVDYFRRVPDPDRGWGWRRSPGHSRSRMPNRR